MAIEYKNSSGAFVVTDPNFTNQKARLEVGNARNQAEAVNLTTLGVILGTAATPGGTAPISRNSNNTLAAGTKVVSDTAITATSFIQLSYKTAGGTQGFLTYILNAGVGYTINSSSGSDTSIVTASVVY